VNCIKCLIQSDLHTLAAKTLDSSMLSIRNVQKKIMSQSFQKFQFLAVSSLQRLVRLVRLGFGKASMGFSNARNPRSKAFFEQLTACEKLQQVLLMVVLLMINNDKHHA
jgi:hypothetical protein